MDMLTMVQYGPIVLGLFIACIAYWQFPAWWANIHTQAAIESSALHDYETAVERYRRVRQISKRAWTTKTRHTFEFVGSQGMGSCLHSLSRFDEAEPHLKRTLELIDGSVQTEELVIAGTRCQYAGCLDLRSQHEPCEQQMQEIERLCSALKAENRFSVLDVVRGHACGMINTKQYRLAERMLRMVIEEAKRFESPDANLIVQSTLNIVQAYQLQGKHAEARQLVESAVSNYADLNDDTLLHSWQVLSSGAAHAGDIKKAIDCSQRVRKLLKRKASAPIEIAQADITLAMNLQLYGDYKQAIPLANDAYERLGSQLHPDSFQMRSAAMQLVPSLFVSGDFVKADEILAGLEDFPREQARLDGLLLTTSIVWRCLFFLHLERNEEALIAARDAMQEYARTHAASEPVVLESAVLLVIALMRENQLEEAKEKLNELNAMNAQRELSFLSEVDSYVVSAELDILMGEFTKGLDKCERALVLLDRGALPTHIEYGLIYLQMGKALSHLGQHAEAIEAFGKAEGIRLQTQSLNQPGFAQLYEEWGDVLERQGEIEAAKNRKSEAADVRQTFEPLAKRSAAAWRERTGLA